MPNETEQRKLISTLRKISICFRSGLTPEFDVEVTGKDKVKYYNITVSDEKNWKIN